MDLCLYCRYASIASTSNHNVYIIVHRKNIYKQCYFNQYTGFVSIINASFRTINNLPCGIPTLIRFDARNLSYWHTTLRTIRIILLYRQILVGNNLYHNLMHHIHPTTCITYFWNYRPTLCLHKHHCHYPDLWNLLLFCTMALDLYVSTHNKHITIH